MNKDAIGNILTITTAITILTFAIGCLVINIHLESYGIVDFNLVKPQAILVGVCCLIFFSIHIVILLMFLNINNFSANPLFKLIYITTIKIMYLTIMLSLFLDTKLSILNPENNPIVFGYKFEIIGYLFTIVVTFPFLYILSYYDIKNNKKDVLTKLSNLSIYIAALSCILLSILSFKQPSFKNLLFYEAELGFLFFMIYLIVFPGKNGSFNEFKGNLFSDEPIIDPNHRIGVLTLLSSCMIIGVSALIFQYSKNIYPFIGQSFGGGKLDKFIYHTSQETVSGLKIYETDKYVFLIDKDSTILKLDWDNIERIIKTK